MPTPMPMSHFKTLVLLLGFSIGLVAATNLYCGDTFKMMSAGRSHSLGLLENGTLLSWGKNADGQLGIGNQTKEATTPQVVVVSPGSEWISIAAGHYSSFGIMKNGTLWAFGSNYFGELGDGTTTGRYLPVQIGSDTDWTIISSGIVHTLGLKKDGSLYAWGSNYYGQLGNDSTRDSLVPIPIQPGKKWSFISTGQYFSFGIQADGSLWGWGNNAKGQLGDGTMRNKQRPTKVEVAEIVSEIKWKMVSGGDGHTVALDENGNYYAWGDNHYAQLGDDTNVPKLVPTLIKTDTTWVSIHAGSYFSMGIASNGTLFGWGDNGKGQIGDGTKNNVRYSPVKVGENLAPWKSLITGNDHALGVTKNGQLVTWGLNEYGQLGLGNNEDQLTPAVCKDRDVCLDGKCAAPPGNLQKVLRSFLIR